MSASDTTKRGARRSLRGADVQVSTGRVATPAPLDIERLLKRLEQQSEEARIAFLSVLAHSLTVDVRAMLIDRPVSDTNLDRVYQINELLHQLTSYVNPRHQQSPVRDVELVRAIASTAEAYGLQASVGRALATARNVITHSGDLGSPSPGLLDNVIALGGRALEAEDRELRASARRRGRHGGLLSTEYERFYQYVVWKSLSKKYDASIESNYTGYLVDLIIIEGGVPHIFEMKYWREETSARIYSEIVRLQSFPHGGFLLVFAANPKRLTDENIRLIGTLPGIGGSASSYRFGTENPKGDASYEFWFAGWPIPSAIDQTSRSLRKDV